MKKFFKLLGKILLWVMVICFLTVINFTLIALILKPKPPLLIIPIIFLSILETVYFYYLMMKRRREVAPADIAKENRLIGVILLICFFAIGAIGSFISLLTIDQKIAIWEKANHILPSNYHYVNKIFNIFRIITHSIAAFGLFKLFKWARIYVMILMVVDIIYSMCFASMYVWPRLPNKTAFIAVAFISNIILLGAIVFYLTRPKVKELFR